MKLQKSVAKEFEMAIPFARVILNKKYGGGAINADTLSLEKARKLYKMGFPYLKKKENKETAE